MKKGGVRKGAGRPKNTGKFCEPTKAIRVPEKDVAAILQAVHNRLYRIPFFEIPISAGFPTPVESETSLSLDLNDLLIKHPAATFFLRVSGSSMINAGIHDNDILVVDRSLEPKSGKIVIAVVNGELTVKRLVINGRTIQLMPENPKFNPIEITEETDLRIWGVVVHVIHSL